MDYRTSLRQISQLPTYATAADALRANRLDWGVELEPVTTASGHAAPARAVVRADTRKPLGVVGLRYAPCDNLTASGWMDQYVPHGVRITGAESFKGGERCVMYAMVGEQPAEVQPGDFVALQLVAAWSHDGTSSTSGSLRVLRLACSNGLVLATDAGRMFSLRHTRRADPSADAIQSQVRAALERFGESVQAFRGLASRTASRAQVNEYVRQVMDFRPDEQTGELTTRSSNVLDSIMARYDQSAALGRELLAANREREERVVAANTGLLDSMLAKFEGGRGQQLNGGGTWWNAYNAVTEHLTHERGRTTESRQESLLFGTSARINEQALSGALSMSGVA